MSLAGGVGAAAQAQDSGLSTEALRGASTVNGNPLPNERLQVLKPALERRLTQVRILRRFEVDDSVGL